MAWRYKFDGGPEKALDFKSSLYVMAALRAFSQEDVRHMPTIRPGVAEYTGHTLELWDDELVDVYPASIYGIGFNECGSATMPVLGKRRR